MNKKLEEKLAMLAFGDMSSEETARLEQEVAGNGEALRVLAQYRGMRTGLKAMGDIPDHQLSTERLRNAVLNRGLKPRARPQMGWLWMPAAAMALTFGVFVIRSSHNSALPGMTGGGIAMAPDSIQNGISEKPGEAFALATASSEIISIAHPVAASLPSAHSMMSHPRRDRDRIEALKDAVVREFDNDLSANHIDPDRNALMSTRSDSPAQSGSPIVLIGSSKDANTGAQKATEVDSANNVVVGG